VTFTAVVTPTPPGGGTPNGSVTFKNGSTVLGTVSLAGGQASLTTSFPTTGSPAITASYADTTDSNYTASTSSFTPTIQAVALETDPSDATTTALFVGGTAGNDTIVFNPGGGSGTV
jgi:hypothetical protein